MTIIKGHHDLRTFVFEDGYHFNINVWCIKMQAEHNILMTNPKYTGYTSFAKAVIGIFRR